MPKEALATTEHSYSQPLSFRDRLAKVLPFRSRNLVITISNPIDNQDRSDQTENEPLRVLEGLSEQEKTSLLVHSGFNIPSQVIRYLKDIHLGLNTGLDPETVVLQAQNRSRLDIISFYQEYLKEAPLLVANHKVVEDRIEPNGYSGISLTDFILRMERDGVEERDGSVLYANREIERAHARARKLKQKLTSVIVSPPGPNGIINPITGCEIEPYEDTQVIIAELQEDGTVVSNTIVSDFNQRQCRELILALGGNVQFIDESQSERELVANIVKAFLIKTEDRDGQTLKTIDVLEKMEQISKTPFVNKLRDQTFSQVKYDLIRRDELFNLDEKCQKQLEQYEKVQHENFSLLIEVVKKLEIEDIDTLTTSDYVLLFRGYPEIERFSYQLRDLILKMSAILRGKDKVNLEEEIANVESKVGCNGGRKQKNRAITLPDHYQEGRCSRCGGMGKVGVCSLMCESCEDDLGVYEENPPQINLIMFPEVKKPDILNTLKFAA